ncbi:hypothetical protein [Synechococcus sp. HK01-R]|nr:hypothetical protein [Synechococcus sp. HK01-R]
MSSSSTATTSLALQRRPTRIGAGVELDVHRRAWLASAFSV